MPIRSIGGIWSADLWKPKYASHVYKVTVAIDMLATLCAPWPPGHRLMFSFGMGMDLFTAIALLCNVLCREGVQSNILVHPLKGHRSGMGQKRCPARARRANAPPCRGVGGLARNLQQHTWHALHTTIESPHSNTLSHRCTCSEPRCAQQSARNCSHECPLSVI